MPVQVSAFPSIYSNKPKNIDLARWLKGSPKYDQIIATLRSCADVKRRRRIKQSLPCVIPSGVFSHPKDDCLKEFSGLMCFDFDHLPHTETIKEVISQNPHVYYAGLSAGGHGLFALVRVARDAKGREYFHRISQFYPGYNPRVVDRQYDYSLRQPPKFGIGVILDIAKKNNVLLNSGR